MTVSGSIYPRVAPTNMSLADKLAAAEKAITELNDAYLRCQVSSHLYIKETKLRELQEKAQVLEVRLRGA